MRNQLEQLNLDMLVGVPVTRIDGRVLHTALGPLIDFAGTNYLGFDFSPELAENGARYEKQWGGLFGLSRLEADPVIYPELERRISSWLGARETIMAPTITLAGFSVMTKLAGQGVMFTDHKVHTVVYEACRLARDHGAKIERFKHQDLNDLEAKLKAHKDVRPKLILVDGVYSISSAKAPLKEMQDLCKKYDAWLYVDDAHGFGLLGQDGRGAVSHAGITMERIFYVSSFAKAFCTHYAFISTPPEYSELLRENCMQYVFSAPLAPYNVGAIQAALDLNAKVGNERRGYLKSLTEEFVGGLRTRGLSILNVDHFPVVYWQIGQVELLAEVAKAMYKMGVLAGLRAYPIVPSDECGMRFALTALHTKAQIQKALGVIDELCARFPLIKKSHAA